MPESKYRGYVKVPLEHMHVVITDRLLASIRQGLAFIVVITSDRALPGLGQNQLEDAFSDVLRKSLKRGPRDIFKHLDAFGDGRLVRSR